MSQSQDPMEAPPSTNPTTTTDPSPKYQINNGSRISSELRTTTDPENDGTAVESVVNLNMSFCQEVLECDEMNEDVKNELNETNENNTMNSSSDSGFDSSDAEESINDEDEDSTCALDELFVEEVEDLRTENRISNLIEDYDGDFGIFTESDIEEWKRKEEILIRRY